MTGVQTCALPILLKFPVPEPDAKSSGRRRALAEWIAAPENPLTWRVLANRIWQHHFGRGLVGTPSNFGFKGERPTHPELLDFLASQLIAEGGRWKPLHKLLLMSATYRQTAGGSNQYSVNSVQSGKRPADAKSTEHWILNTDYSKAAALDPEKIGRAHV